MNLLPANVTIRHSPLDIWVALLPGLDLGLEDPEAVADAGCGAREASVSGRCVALRIRPRFFSRPGECLGMWKSAVNILNL